MTSQLLGVYLLSVNVLTLAVYVIDKIKAKRHVWRVSELTLLALAAVGGSVGAMVAIFVVRHKSRHLKFRYGVPLILLLQVALAVWLTRA